MSQFHTGHCALYNMLEAKIPARDPEDLNLNHILMCAAMMYHQTLREIHTHTHTLGI